MRLSETAEPGVRYAAAADGVRIAFAEMAGPYGAALGVPLVVPPPGVWSTMQLEWQVAPQRAWLERLARARRVVRYDVRGTV
jgi:hypothetical protein